jgi:hypothetical protein
VNESTMSQSCCVNLEDKARCLPSSDFDILSRPRLVEWILSRINAKLVRRKILLEAEKILLT